MNDNGIPDTTEERFAVAVRIIEHATTMGIALEDIVIDPLVLAMGASTRICLHCDAGASANST